MTKSELIVNLAQKHSHIPQSDIELAVNALLKHITLVLSQGIRVEIRGFGVFSVRYRAAKIGRNPKTGESVPLTEKYVPCFKPGKEMAIRINTSV